MSKLHKYIELPLVASGDITIYADDKNEVYVVTGTETLTANSDITGSGFTDGHKVKIFYSGDLTLDSNTFTILGLTIPENLCDKKFVVDAEYFDGAWITNILPDFSQTGIIPDTSIPDDSITTAKIQDGAVEIDKIEILAKGDILTSDGTQNVVINGTEAQIPITKADGSLAFVSLSGGATIDENGVVTLSITQSLQTAWGGGNTITISNNSNKPVTITNNDTTNNPFSLIVANNTSNYAVGIGITTPSGKGIFLSSANTTAATTNYTNVNILNASHSVHETYVTYGVGMGVGQNFNGYKFDVNLSQSAAASSSVYAFNSTVSIGNTSSSKVYIYKGAVNGTFAPVSASAIYGNYFDVALITSSNNSSIYGSLINLTSNLITDGSFYGYAIDAGSPQTSLTVDRFYGYYQRVDYILNTGGVAASIFIDNTHGDVLTATTSEYGIYMSLGSASADEVNSARYGYYTNIVTGSTSGSVVGMSTVMAGTQVAGTRRNIIIADSTTLNGAAVEYYGIYLSGGAITNTLSSAATGVYISDGGRLTKCIDIVSTTAAGYAIHITSASSNSAITVSGTSGASVISATSAASIAGIVSAVTVSATNGGAGDEVAFTINGTCAENGTYSNTVVTANPDGFVKIYQDGAVRYVPFYNTKPA